MSLDAEPRQELPPHPNQRRGAPTGVRPINFSGLQDLSGACAPCRFLRAIGPRPLDRAAALLPRMVRDHVPSNYFRALGVTL